MQLGKLEGEKAVTAIVKLTLCEAEALMMFIADRPELWRLHAVGFGVEDPMGLPRALAEGHAKGVGSRARLQPRRIPETEKQKIERRYERRASK